MSPDLPRDQANWIDRGCEIAPHCLECPLPECRYLMPPKRAGALIAAARVRALTEAGRTADQIAAELGMSRRTVFRLKKYGSGDALPVVRVE